MNRKVEHERYVSVTTSNRVVLELPDFLDLLDQWGPREKKENPVHRALTESLSA